MKNMKIMKRIISLLLAVNMCPAIIVRASASEENISDTTPPESSYADFCDDYYASTELYTVYDKNGADISTSYYLATIGWYQDDNIEAIYDYMRENVSRYRKIELSSNGKARGAYQSAKQTETFIGYVDNTTINGFDIVYTLTGEFTYNANTGKISSYSSPSISLTHVGISNLVSGEMTNASTSASKTSDGYGVNFEGHFYVLSTQYIPVGLASVPFRTETTGPYSASFTAYGD